MLRKEANGWVFYIEKSKLIGPTGPPGPAADTINILNGRQNQNYGHAVNIMGDHNINHGDNVYINGKNNENTVNHSLILGDSNINKALASIISGHNHINSGRYSGIFSGGHHKNTGTYSSCVSGHHGHNDGNSSVVLGGSYNNISSDCAVSLGGHCLEIDTDNSVSMGRYNLDDGSLLSVGNGTALGRSNAFTVNELGEVGAYQYLTPMNAIGVQLPASEVLSNGDTVFMESGKIRRCLEDETPIGVVSTNVGVICNYESERMVTDEQGTPIYEEVEEEIEVPDIHQVETESQVLVERDGYYERKNIKVVQNVIRTEMLPVKNEQGEIVGKHPKICYTNKRVVYRRPKILKIDSEETELKYTVALIGLARVNPGCQVASVWQKIDQHLYLLR